MQYIIVGGYAVAFHGHPRYTNDIDFWILPNPENGEKLLTALHDFGFASLELAVDDFTIPNKVIQLGQPPCRIDILSSISGVNFEESFPSSKEMEIDGLTVRFIGLDDLIKNKKATGRLKDLSDIEELEE